jgi:hypothetical protein
MQTYTTNFIFQQISYFLSRRRINDHSFMYLLVSVLMFSLSFGILDFFIVFPFVCYAYTSISNVIRIQTLVYKFYDIFMVLFVIRTTYCHKVVHTPWLRIVTAKEKIIDFNKGNSDNWYFCYFFTKNPSSNRLISDIYSKNAGFEGSLSHFVHSSKRLHYAEKL